MTGARIVVAGLVHRIRASSVATEEFLITKRPADAAFYPNVWVLPGGGVERGDYRARDDGVAALHTALYRELTEECGDTLLTFGKPRLLCERTFIRGDDTPVLVLTYMLDWFSGECELSREVADWAWVTAREAAGYDLIGTTLEEIELADVRI